MSNKRISVLDIFRSPNKFSDRFKEQESVEEISFYVQVSYETNGQVKYLDENERPRITEFIGNSWTITFLKKVSRKTSLSIFLYNHKFKKDQVVSLTKKINGEIVNIKSFAIIGENNYEGWFKIE
jgi:hypothetical protein